MHNRAVTVYMNNRFALEYRDSPTSHCVYIKHGNNLIPISIPPCSHSPQAKFRLSQAKRVTIYKYVGKGRIYGSNHATQYYVGIHRMCVCIPGHIHKRPLMHVYQYPSLFLLLFLESLYVSTRFYLLPANCMVIILLSYMYIHNQHQHLYLSKEPSLKSLHVHSLKTF